MQRKLGRNVGRPIRLLAFTIAFLAGFGFTSAWAGIAQDGRISTNNNLDGSSIYVQGDSFDARSGCVIYSLLIWDSEGTNHHVETGLVTCDSGYTLKGNCVGGYFFAERYDGTDYFCNVGSSFNNGSLYYTYNKRNTDTSTTMTGYVPGGQVSQSGYGLDQDTYTLAWGEATASATVCGDGQGLFSTWNKFKVGSGWSAVSNANIFHGGSMSPCWTVGVQDGNGGFHVW